MTKGEIKTDSMMCEYTLHSLNLSKCDFYQLVPRNKIEWNFNWNTKYSFYEDTLEIFAGLNIKEYVIYSSSLW